MQCGACVWCVTRLSHFRAFVLQGARKVCWSPSCCESCAMMSTVVLRSFGIFWVSSFFVCFNITPGQTHFGLSECFLRLLNVSTGCCGENSLCFRDIWFNGFSPPFLLIIFKHGSFLDIKPTSGFNIYGSLSPSCIKLSLFTVVFCAKFLY